MINSHEAEINVDILNMSDVVHGHEDDHEYDKDEEQDELWRADLLLLQVGPASVEAAVGGVDLGQLRVPRTPWDRRQLWRQTQAQYVAKFTELLRQRLFFSDKSKKKKNYFENLRICF